MAEASLDDVQRFAQFCFERVVAERAQIGMSSRVRLNAPAGGLARRERRLARPVVVLAHVVRGQKQRRRGSERGECRRSRSGQRAHAVIEGQRHAALAYRFGQQRFQRHDLVVPGVHGTYQRLELGARDRERTYNRWRSYPTDRGSPSAI